METNGWDTVNALSVTRVNALLADGAATVVTTFSFAGQVFGTGHRGSGSFGPWRLLPGDPGQLLRLALPITGGEIASDGGRNRLDLGGLTAIVVVSLAVLPSRNSVDDTAQSLVFDFSGAGVLGGEPELGLVTPVALTGPGDRLAALGEAGTALVLDGIAASLVTDAATMSHAFATLLSAGAGTAGAYAYLRPLRENNPGYLTLLRAGAGKDVTALPRFVSPDLFTGDPEFAMALSRERFLREIVLPALPDALGGDASAASVGYDPGSATLVNTRHVAIRSTKVGAIRYSPRITALSVGVTGGELTVAASGDCDLGAGISMSYWVRSAPRMAFDAATARISFTRDPAPRSGHDVDIPWWFSLGGVLVRSVTELVVAVITDDLTGALDTRLAALGLDRWATASVRWLGLPAITVDAATLSGGLVLTGHPA